MELWSPGCLDGVQPLHWQAHSSRHVAGDRIDAELWFCARISS